MAQIKSPKKQKAEKPTKPIKQPLKAGIDNTSSEKNEKGTGDTKTISEVPGMAPNLMLHFANKRSTVPARLGAQSL